MSNKILFCVVISIASLVPVDGSCIEAPSLPEPKSSCVSDLSHLRIDQAWGGVTVRFSFIESPNYFYIAYYNKDRWLTVAQVDKCTYEVKKRILESRFGGWDSHNSIDMKLDKNNILHVVGNMHASRLVYAKMQTVNDVGSMKLIRTMTGSNEDKVTYPQFLELFDGRLIFTYRDGVSGGGRQIVNVLDEDGWHRQTDLPLFDGKAKASAYMSNIFKGQDGYFHVAWTWRAKARVETNYSLNYMKTRDFSIWQDAYGKSIQLPVTPDSALVVDNIPQENGLINNIRVGGDRDGRAVISYLKFDKNGFSQLYHARFEKQWKIFQASAWSYRWDPRGTGTIPFLINFGGTSVVDGKVVESIRHPVMGSGWFVYNNESLQVINFLRDMPAVKEIPRSLTPEMKGDMMNRVASGLNDGWFIRWSSLPADNRDQKKNCTSNNCNYIRVLYLEKY